jgi:hypothetical protein
MLLFKKPEVEALFRVKERLGLNSQSSLSFKGGRGKTK